MEDIDAILSNIDWCPIDIPKFPYPDMYLELNGQSYFWDMNRMDKDGCLDTELVDRYPLLANWFAMLPYTNIEFMRFSRQREEAPPHRDKAKDARTGWIEPSGYRIVIKGDRCNSLYVVKDGQRIYPILPETTDVYALRYTETLHGVHMDPNRIIIYILGQLDANRHKQLLKKSIDTYPEHVIYR